MRVDIEQPHLSVEERFVSKGEAVCGQPPVLQVVGPEHVQLMTSLNRTLIPATKFDHARIGIRVEDISHFSKYGYNIVIDKSLVSKLPHEIVLFAFSVCRIRC